MKREFHVHTTQDNEEAANAADVIIVAVKPQILPAVTKTSRAAIQAKKSLVVSVAAGVRENTIQQWLGGNIPIVRAMPNTPALIGCGATALFANHYVSAEQKNLAENILRAVGMVVWVNQENLLDAVTALSGSGPAYFFLMIEAMQAAGEKCGLSPDISRVLTLQTAYGACRMALDSDKTVVELRRQVTSPGGTTEAAIGALEAENIRDIYLKAVIAAKKRSEELATLLEKGEFQ
jgi:pyrroline-5-carboxylate reductase